MPEDVDPFDDDLVPVKFPRHTPQRSGRLRLVIVIGALFFLAVAFVSSVDLYTDLLWYRSLGFQAVFSTILGTKVVAGLITMLVVTALTYANFRLALSLAPDFSSPKVIRLDGGRTIEVPDAGRILRFLALPVSAVIGLLAGSIGWNSWELFQLYLKQVPFGVADPVFGRDVAFYVFTLPVLAWIERALFGIVAVNLVVASIVAFATGGVSMRSLRDPRDASHGARAHLVGLVAALFVSFAFSAWLSIPNLLFSNDGPVAGACYTDLSARLPLLWIQVVVALAAAGLAAVSARGHSNKPLLIGVAAYILVVVAGGIYPSSVQRLSVAPNELAKETPYIERNIEATRRAFGLDAVDERELEGEAVLTSADVEANRATIESIRLWDQQPLLDTFAQIQEIRTYYDFRSVDNDRYRLDGKLKQIMLSARELSIESLPNRNWINERLTFTHGYGLTLGPVTEVTPEGLPVLFVKDIPPAATNPIFEVKRPEIYFGELPSDPVFVKTTTKEFSYPAGDDNVFGTYEGEDGVSIGSTWRQILFALRLADMKLLLSDAMTPESRVLLNRNIRERLQLVAPFLRFDADPYLVIYEGRLVWIADAYTATDMYPYAQPIGGITYIRNSVKATVDAYDGTVRLYVTDESDPIIRTYDRIFPGIFTPLSAMPAGLREHLRYPEDIFRLQAAIYSTYHMRSPQVFYNKEDQWALASVASAQAGAPPEAMEPYYTVMRLPGGKDEEFILMLPFTPQRKDNLASWMAARADGENYGKLVVYRFPKQRLVYGPNQITARINQDPEISRQLSLWNQRGSQVILGHLMVVPIEESLVYVQPLYLRAESGKIPELRRVIVAVDNRIAMEETLDASLARIFGAPANAAPAPNPHETGAAPSPGTSAAAPDLAAEARAHYERALAAQRAGDWATYGDEIKKLGEVLDRMTPSPNGPQ